MSLSQLTVSRLIDVVRKDKVSVERINSILRHIPMLGSAAGPIRNFGMALGHTYIDPALKLGARYHQGRYGGSLGKDFLPFDPSADGSMGQEWQCTGIVEAAVEAITRAKLQLPAVKEAMLKSRSASYSHAGVGINTTDGGEYVIDWWLTLDVESPYVFRLSDWDKAKSDKGIPYSEFRGFA